MEGENVKGHCFNLSRLDYRQHVYIRGALLQGGFWIGDKLELCKRGADGKMTFGGDGSSPDNAADSCSDLVDELGLPLENYETAEILRSSNPDLYPPFADSRVRCSVVCGVAS